LARGDRSCPSCWQGDLAGDAWVPDALESASAKIVTVWRPDERRNHHFVRFRGLY
jgi:hypothetical protein